MQAEKEKRSYAEDRSERARRRISRAIEGVLCKLSVLKAQVFLSSDPLFLNSTISATGYTLVTHDCLTGTRAEELDDHRHINWNSNEFASTKLRKSFLSAEMSGVWAMDFEADGYLGWREVTNAWWRRHGGWTIRNLIPGNITVS